MYDVIVAHVVAGAADEHLKVWILLIGALHRQLVQLTLDHVQENSHDLPKEDVDLERAKVDDDGGSPVIFLALVEVLDLIAAHAVVDAAPLFRDVRLDAKFYFCFELRPQPPVEDHVHNADEVEKRISPSHKDSGVSAEKLECLLKALDDEEQAASEVHPNSDKYVLVEVP